MRRGDDPAHRRLVEDHVARLLGIGDRRQPGFPCPPVRDPLVMLGREIERGLQPGAGPVDGRRRQSLRQPVAPAAQFAAPPAARRPCRAAPAGRCIRDPRDVADVAAAGSQVGFVGCRAPRRPSPASRLSSPRLSSRPSVRAFSCACQKSRTLPSASSKSSACRSPCPVAALVQDAAHTQVPAVWLRR